MLLLYIIYTYKKKILDNYWQARKKLKLQANLRDVLGKPTKTTRSEPAGAEEILITEAPYGFYPCLEKETCFYTVIIKRKPGRA